MGAWGSACDRPCLPCGHASLLWALTEEEDASCGVQAAPESQHLHRQAFWGWVAFFVYVPLLHCTCACHGACTSCMCASDKAIGESDPNMSEDAKAMARLQEQRVREEARRNKKKGRSFSYPLICARIRGRSSCAACDVLNSVADCSDGLAAQADRSLYSESMRRPMMMAVPWAVSPTWARTLLIWTTSMT
eukprot:scaffold221156_cov19-Tisochrysis_lutea.AAC.1